MSDIGDRRLDALAVARRGRGAVKVIGQQEYVEVISYRGLNYSILTRYGDRNRVYNLMCPHNGRIIGRSYDSKMKAVYDYYRNHRCSDTIYKRVSICKYMQPEQALKSRIRQRLTEKGIYWDSVQQGQFAKPGQPDIIACMNGRFVQIEVKTPAGEVRPIQKVRRDEICSQGGDYHIVRSIQELDTIIGGYGI